MKACRVLAVVVVLSTALMGLNLGVARAEPAQATAEKWSNPGTWGGHLPAEGQAVTIPSGKTVLLDVSPPPLASLKIDGALLFDEQDLQLQTDWIMVNGLLQVGTEQRPFAHHATITLLDRKPGEQILGMGDKVLGVMAGSLELHGQPRAVSWTRLAATATAGSDQIALERPVDWRPGDHLVVASTDYDPAQAEEVVVKEVAAGVVTLAAPLARTHWGDYQMYGGTALDERAEVGLLSRNVVVQGDEGSETGGFGGHVMVMGGTAHIEGVEVTRMGQKGKLARYPIHFHLLGDRPDAYVRNSSIHHTFNRCLTIHGTNKVTVRDNVAFDAIGHCYFLEDGAEIGNRLEGNLGVMTHAAAEGKALLPSDATPATFWITNPDNVVRGNAAAGSEGTGFWYALPEHPTGLSRTAETNKTVWPRRTPLLGFGGNVAHSNGFRGLNVDDGPKPDGTTENAFYDPHLNPIPPAADAADSPVVGATFADFTAYKNRERGAWFDGANIRLAGAVLADNAIGATLAANASFLEDSLIVGESANAGTPAEGETAGLAGRSLPEPSQPDLILRGYEFYGGPVGLRNVVFAGFHPNSQRQAAGLGFLAQNPFPFDQHNFVAGLTWLDNSNRVFMEDALPENDGNKTSIFLDQSGSVSGVAGGVVVPNQPFLVDATCQGRAAWNGFVCAAPYDQLYLENADPKPGPVGPAILRRADGVELTLAGIPGENAKVPSQAFDAILPGNAAYTVQLGATPAHLRFTLSVQRAGDWVRLSIPYTGGTPFVYPAYADGPESALRRAASLAELDASQGDAFFADGRTVELKLMVPPATTDVALDVCRTTGCA